MTPTDVQLKIFQLFLWIICNVSKFDNASGCLVIFKQHKIHQILGIIFKRFLLKIFKKFQCFHVVANCCNFHILHCPTQKRYFGYVVFCVSHLNPVNAIALITQFAALFLPKQDTSLVFCAISYGQSTRFPAQWGSQYLLIKNFRTM